MFLKLPLIQHWNSGGRQLNTIPAHDVVADDVVSLGVGVGGGDGELAVGGEEVGGGGRGV